MFSESGKEEPWFFLPVDLWAVLEEGSRTVAPKSQWGTAEDAAPQRQEFPQWTVGSMGCSRGCGLTVPSNTYFSWLTEEATPNPPKGCHLKVWFIFIWTGARSVSFEKHFSQNGNCALGLSPQKWNLTCLKFKFTYLHVPVSAARSPEAWTHAIQTADENLIIFLVLIKFFKFSFYLLVSIRLYLVSDLAKAFLCSDQLIENNHVRQLWYISLVQIICTHLLATPFLTVMSS